MIALLVGGVIAAPFAAFLVRHADASVMGVVVGTLLLIVNARTLLLELDVPGPLRLPVVLAIAAVGASLTLRVQRHARSLTPVPDQPTPVPDQLAPVPAPVALAD